MKDLSALAPHRYRFVNLTIVIAGFLTLLLLKLLNYEYVGNWGCRIFIVNHFIIILGLIRVTLSKEKHEDERIEKIRYRLMKFSYVLTITGVSLYTAISILDRVNFNLFAILYVIEFVLILYQILFRYILATNPNWIFTEKPKNNRAVLFTACCLFFLIGWIIYAVIIFKV